MPDSVTKAPQPRPLDDETAAALTLYNTYLVADREQQAHQRALRKAEKAKDEAAATVRELNDRKASAADMAAAEAAYREAVEALRLLRDGDQAAPQDTSDEAQDVDAVEDQEAPVAEQGAPQTQEAPQTEADAETPTEVEDAEPDAGASTQDEDSERDSPGTGPGPLGPGLLTQGECQDANTGE